LFTNNYYKKSRAFLSVSLLADGSVETRFSVFPTIHIVANFGLGFVRLALLFALLGIVTLTCFHVICFE
jgi:hypothetical protein